MDCVCCTKDSEVPWESLLDVAPKVRTSFVEARSRKALGLNLGWKKRQQMRALAKPSCNRQAELTEESDSTARHTLGSSQHKSPTKAASQKQHLIHQLTERNRQLKLLLRSELLPLEDQYLRLFVESRRKEVLIDLLARRLDVLADAREISPNGNGV